MNKERREQLTDVSELLSEAMNRLDEIREEEQEAYDNLPDGLQNGANGNSMLDAIDMMNSWESRVNDIITIIVEYSSGKRTIEQANLTEYKREEPSPLAQYCPDSNHSITLHPYKEKSLVVRGNTRDIKEKLKKFGAKFNSRLEGGAGWIIPKSQENEFRNEFAKFI